MRKGSESGDVITKQPGDMGPRYGDLMPAPDRFQAAAFTLLQT
jgi:hypothetical protein